MHRLLPAILTTFLLATLVPLRAQLDATLEFIDVGDYRVPRAAPEITVVGGKVSLEVAVNSSAPLTEPLYLTLMEITAAGELPARTLNERAEATDRRSVYRARFDFQLLAPVGETQSYRLIFWTTVGDETRLRRNVGSAILTLCPTDTMEPLRRLGNRNSIIFDTRGATSDPAITGLKSVFNSFGIAYSETPGSALSDISADAVFITTDQRLASAGRFADTHVVYFSTDADTLPLIRVHEGGAVLQLAADAFADIEGNVHSKITLMRYLETLVEAE